tara:strand:- start:3226 stop:4062 length:837 start_codon:yes stop_codon:yes gene_type:complete
MEETATSTTSETPGVASPGTILGSGDLPSSESSGSFNPDTLPVELRNEPSLRNFKSWDDLAKSYVHAVKKLGAPGEELVRVPTNGDMNELYDRMGRPNSPSEYKFDSETPDEFKQFAHDTGLTQDQASKLHGYLGNLGRETNDKAQKAYEQEQLHYQNQLNQEWGDDYRKNSELARRAFLQFADQDLVKFMEQTGLGNHPGFAKMFNRMGEFLTEDNRLVGGNDGLVGGMSPTTAQAKITERKSDPEFMAAYMNGEHPEHANAVKEFQSLFNYLHPEN